MRVRTRLSIFLSIALMATASGAWAQATRTGTPRTVPSIPDVSNRTLTPPRPAGLGGNLPPGHGGPNPSAARPQTAPGVLEALGLLRVCGPGGVLSAQGAAANPGRTRARALVCGG